LAERQFGDFVSGVRIHYDFYFAGEDKHNHFTRNPTIQLFAMTVNAAINGMMSDACQTPFVIQEYLNDERQRQPDRRDPFCNSEPA
jgi:hypothetical protein